MTLLLLLTGTGTSSAPVYTGLGVFGVDTRRRVEALDVRLREAVYTPALITLEDGTGYWLFEDGTRIVWEPGDTGTAGQVRRRIGNLRVRGQSD